MMRGSFSAVRMARGTRVHLEAVNDNPGPAVVVMNHASWWDPLIGLYLAKRLAPAHQLLAPMEARQLQKFGILRKVGVFGLDPDHADSLPMMLEYVSREFNREPRTSLWITPQGQFTDVRLPVRIRPGAAALAARTPGVRVVSVAIEMPFWLDRYPELLVRLERCDAPVGMGESGNAAAGPSTSAWHRAIAHGMQRNADELARIAAARDPANFETLLEGRSGRINPVYNLWLKARGRSSRLEATTRTPSHSAGRAASGPLDANREPLA